LGAFLLESQQDVLCLTYCVVAIVVVVVVVVVVIVVVVVGFIL